jgi:hypothetical protein
MHGASESVPTCFLFFLEALSGSSQGHNCGSGLFVDTFTDSQLSPCMLGLDLSASANIFFWIKGLFHLEGSSLYTKYLASLLQSSHIFDTAQYVCRKENQKPTR